MCFRHCLTAVLLLAASAPAMADMYLFDGRAWTAGTHAENELRGQEVADVQDRVARASFAKPTHNLPLTRFVDAIRMSLTGCSLQEPREVRRVPLSQACK